MSGPFELIAAFCTPGIVRTLSSNALANVSMFSRLIIVLPRQLETGGEKSARLVTQRERLQPRKTFQNQTRRDEQGQGERDFANHEPITRAFR